MSRWGSVKAWAGRLALVVLVPILVLALLEGGVSLLLLGKDLAGSRPTQVAETRHSRYDAELGWVSEPHVALPEMYGPGHPLHTNARGFRGRAETADSPPQGRRRVICSGDSFTLGFGVGDDDTWCSLLASRDSALESVNMGQGGYGLDQAFLWYRRDGMSLAHDVHVFAYITDDFRRMKEGHFLGYGKPMLELRGDSLVAINVPAPPPRTRYTWFNNSLEAVQRLRLFQLAARVGRRSGANADAGAVTADSATAAVASAVIRDLARFHSARGSRLIVVHLPVRQDVSAEFSADWRRLMRAASEREGATFVDLVEAFRRLPTDSIPPLFIPWGSTEYVGGGGHYTESGNRWVAGHLMPVIRAALRGLPNVGGRPAPVDSRTAGRRPD